MHIHRPVCERAARALRPEVSAQETGRCFLFVGSPSNDQAEGLNLPFLSSYTDANKAFAFCGEAQRYYELCGFKTRVLPASLTSAEEVMQLAGVHHITVSPPLLAELAATPAEGWKSSDVVGQTLRATPIPPASAGDLYDSIVRDEAAWRLAFTRSSNGGSEGKIIQAINIFLRMQDDLENMARQQSAVV